MTNNSIDYQFYRVETIDKNTIVSLGENGIEQGEEMAIEYKKLPADNFPNQVYDIDEDEIEVNERGYIEYEVFEKIKKDETDETVIINAGTGQGKTYNTFKLIEEYQNDYIIVIAVPFLSLADKYYNRVLEIEGITKDNVVNSKTAFDKELTEQQIKSLSQRKIHIITINLLLGNSGESALLQSRNKLDYIDKLIAYANSEISEESSTKKVIWFFDEIHEGVHNFKTKLIYNLFKWRNLIHKIYILSATFTESAIVVIRYLSELTNYRIRIINSKRSRNPIERQAKLFLFVAQGNYGGKDGIESLYPLTSYIENHIEQGDSINILSYSKKLADEITEGKNELKKIFKSSRKKINLLTSETKNIFDVNKINIGTTFKTGIDIESPNSLYIIITPTGVKEGRMSKKSYGLFTDGVPAILQSIARLRNGGTIIVVIPKPKVLITGRYLKNRLPSHTYFDSFRSMRGEETPFEVSPFKSYSEQKRLLKNFYNLQKDRLRAEIEYIEEQDRTNLPYLSYPTLNEFIRDEGQYYLTSSFHSFGAEIYPYIIWAAYHNQLPNCQFEGFILPTKEEIFFTKLNMSSGIDSIMEVHHIMPNNYTRQHVFKNGDKIDFEIMTRIIEKHAIIIEDKKVSRWFTKPYFGEMLLQKYAYYKGRTNQSTPYSEIDYILDQIVTAKNLTNPEIGRIKSAERPLIYAYNNLNKLRGYFLKMIEDPIEEKFYNNYELEERIDFSTGFIQLVRGTVGVLAKDDLFIKNNVFKSLKSIDKKIRERSMRGQNGVYQLVYQYFRDAFLEIEKRPDGKYVEYRDEDRKRRFKVLGIRPLPELNHALNFLYPPITLQSNEEQEIATP